MRGTVARRLRNTARKISAPTKYKRSFVGPIICEGYKRTYKDMKKAYKRSKQNGIQL